MKKWLVIFTLTIASVLNLSVIHETVSAQNTPTAPGTFSRIYFKDGTIIGPQERWGAGSPNGVLTAPKGSTYRNTTDGSLWTNTDGATAWIQLASGGSAAPSTAQYWTGAADSGLSAEKNLGALATALVINTAGVPSAYAGVTCTNQFLRILSAVGAGTCASVANADLAGSIAASKLIGSDIATVGTITSGVWNGTAITVPNGGTGISSGTSGGIPYYSSTTTIASSGALTANLPVFGGGAGAAPIVGTRSGNTTQVVTTTGTQTSGRCVEIDANGNHIAAAAACGSGGGSSVEFNGDIIIRKASDESVTSSTTLQSDDTFVFPIGVSETWTHELHLVLTGDTAGDFKFCLNVPSGATGLMSIVTALVSGSTGTSGDLVVTSTTDLTDSCGFVVATATGVSTTATIRATVVNSTTAGNVTLRWAQNSSNATATVVKANSVSVSNRVDLQGGQAAVLTSSYASRSAAAVGGRLFLPNNGFYVERDTGSAWAPWGPIFPMTPPVDGDFSWVNQGSSTVSTTNGGIFLSTPAASGDNLRMRVKSAPATPYTITAAFLPLLWGSDNSGVAVNNAEVGLVFRQSSDGKAIVFAMSTPSSGLQMPVQKWTNATTFSATYSGPNSTRWFVGTPVFFRIADNGTNRICSISTDGINFVQVHTVSRTDFLTADQVGFFVQSGNTTNPASMTLLSWKQE